MDLTINSNKYTKDADKEREKYRKRVENENEITKKEEDEYNREFKNKKYYDINPTK